MKKLFILILVVLLLFSFTACDSNLKNSESKEINNENVNSSVEKIYQDFLSGKTTAVYADGSKIDIDYLAEKASPGTLTYALFDRNGDYIPELCINNSYYVITFWVSDGTLKLWREDNYNMKILSNGNTLEIHHGGAPNHSDYAYHVYSYSGEMISSITLSVLTKNDIDILENEYTQCVNIYNGVTQQNPVAIEISKEYFNQILDSIEKISEAEISWKSIK